MFSDLDSGAEIDVYGVSGSPERAGRSVSLSSQFSLCGGEKRVGDGCRTRKWSHDAPSCQLNAGAKDMGKLRGAGAGYVMLSKVLRYL